jgi:diguanylate cyclase (GGDEF)-like protein
MINDELGHDAGDQALIDAANLLRKTFRESDIIARIGGDEFVVLLTDLAQPDIEDIVIRHVTNNLEIHNDQSGRNYILIFSMGVVYYNPERPCSVSELLTRADELMYEDKKRHRLEKSLHPLKIEKTERRAYMRHKADDNYWVELEHAEKARIKDISAGGICLKLPRQLSVDSIHELRISPSPNGTIALKGKVVWSAMSDVDGDPHRYEAGIKFVDTNTALKQFIDEFISAVSSGI